MSRDLGRDVPDLEKLYARKLWADFSYPNVVPLFGGIKKVLAQVFGCHGFFGPEKFALRKYLGGRGGGGRCVKQVQCGKLAF